MNMGSGINWPRKVVEVEMLATGTLTRGIKRRKEKDFLVLSKALIQ